MLIHPAPTALLRAATAAVGVAALTAGALGSAVPAHADAAVSPKKSAITIVGAGWGHGKGMSQYGAYGAATKGLKYDEIIDFYYPGTTLDELPGGNVIRVWITADTDKSLAVRPVAGQKVVDSKGVSVTLPTGKKYNKWRISRSGDKRVLAYRDPKGTYTRLSNKLDPKRVWYIQNSKTGTVKLAMPNGNTKTYRGKLALRFSGTGARTVNYVSMETYLRGVVPAEMPASWSAEAVKAQAVAARTYAAKLRSVVSSGSIYDLCDTTACQVYRGVAVEQPASDKAISGTANKVVEYKDKLALTMFSSSNGGWSASAGADYPYLKAKKDPYDGLKRDQTWSVTLSSAKIQKAYTSVGTLKSVQITDRDGDGTYGGRVEKVKITGAKGSVTVTGASFKSKFGLKERLFKVIGGGDPATTTANYLHWQALGGTASNLGEPTGAEKVVAGGSVLAFPNADLWWSPDTGSHLLTGPVRAAYNDLGGATSKLGFPKTDVVTSDTGTSADFELGRIACPTSGDCVVSYG
ncbi:MAG TPA: SpoIID/LytB domain-containing protein [Propionicimonas sp.]|jgi:SpoIID/LytB domain protein|uniref:SpoIID/LytB domain-containing protein n=1 Tax=Propionicimonas sp. TaxID=1955623 RepID=UPI002F4205E1